MGEGCLMENKNDPFLTKDGHRIMSLKELRDFLITADEGMFYHHVTEQKNDFENWIRNSLKNPSLADKIKDQKTTEGIIRRIDFFLSEGEFQDAFIKTAAGISKQAQKELSSRAKKEKEIMSYEIKAAESKTTDNNLTLTKATLMPKPEPQAEAEGVRWVKTGVPGFDELITNGIPHGSSVLISGGPGTGKTTFCLQVLGGAAEKGESCLYLTFEEDVHRLKQHMKNYGWDPDKLEREGKLLIKKMQPFDLSRSVEALLARASGELTIELDEIEGIIPKGFKPDRIVLDSLSAVAAAFIGKEEGYRIYIEQLFNLFKGVGATSFLITEIEQDTSKYSRTGIEEFLADAVFVFYNIRQKNTRLNALEILKIRGTPHQKKIVPFRMLSNQGIVVYPREEVFA